MGLSRGVICIIRVDRWRSVHRRRTYKRGVQGRRVGTIRGIMAKYRKKPVVIEAIQWGGFNKQIVIPDVHEFDPYGENDDFGVNGKCSYCGGFSDAHGYIQTLEGGHIVCPNDWIITGIQSERYPCKPDIFEATYDLCD